MFPFVLAVFCNPVMAQTGTSHSAPVAAVDELRFDFAGTRAATLVYWRIDENGQGEVSAQWPLGWSVESDSGFGNYRFSQGIHRIDIGRGGYRILKMALHDFLSGKAAADLSGDAGNGCKLQADGGRVLTWRQEGLDHRLLLPGGCRSALRSALEARLDASWQTIARIMMYRGYMSVSETMPDQSPVIRKPLVLSMNVENVWTGNHVDWELRPDGKGSFKTLQPINVAKPDLDPLSFNYVAAGEYIFDVGESGYLAIRRELDAYISGPAGKTECVGSWSDQPMARLRWFENGKMKQGINTDTACPDYGERVNWTTAFLAEKLVKR